MIKIKKALILDFSHTLAVSVLHYLCQLKWLLPLVQNLKRGNLIL